MELRINIFEALESNVKELSSRVPGHAKNVGILENKLVYLDDRIRRNNVPVFEIAENRGIAENLAYPASVGAKTGEG